MVSPEYQRPWTYNVRKRNGLETDPEGVQLEIPLDSLMFVFQNAYLFLCMSVSPVHVYVHHMHTLESRKGCQTSKNWH